jgi:hypothetical protein
MLGGQRVQLIAIVDLLDVGGGDYWKPADRTCTNAQWRSPNSNPNSSLLSCEQLPTMQHLPHAFAHVQHLPDVFPGNSHTSIYTLHSIIASKGAAQTETLPCYLKTSICNRRLKTLHAFVNTTC